MTIWGNSYYYFETPDYEDCFRKVWFMSKVSLVVCTSYCGFDLLLERVGKPRKLMPPSYVVGRLVRYNGAPLATAVAGATTANMLAKVRGNADDGWNYFLGYGIPAGIIWTNFFKSVKGGAEHSFKGALLGFAFGCAASILKKSHMSDWTLYSDQVMFGSVVRNGPFGGDHWGDMRIPWLTWEDPGRRPQS